MNRIRWFDAVRAFGLFLVLGYHLSYIQLPGGFLGVDVFFTFSGYLITALFMEDIRNKGEFNLLKYYERRIRRIVIPLYLSIAFTLPFALLISPDFTVGISRHLASALSFTANWLNISQGLNYEAQFLPQLYMHTWSLSVLMQFYVAWGAICALLSALTKKIYNRYSARRYTCLKIVIISISAALAICSYIYMQYLYAENTDLNVIYFNTFPRLFPFFIGSAAAAVWGMHTKQDSVIKGRVLSKYPRLIAAALIVVIAIVVAVILLVFSQFSFYDGFIYRYGFLFTSLFTVALIYCTRGLHILMPKNINEPRALKAAADMSYNIYLFHWPLFIIISALIMNHTMASLTTLAVTLVFSALMTYGVMWLRRADSFIAYALNKSSADALRYKRIVVTVGSALLVCAVAAGSVVVAKAPSITSVELSYTVSYVEGDINELVALKSEIEAVNDTPVLFPGSGAPLLANILIEANSLREALPESIERPPVIEESVTIAEDVKAAEGVKVAEGVTIIGDSVSLGARVTMMDRIPNSYVDAEVNRTIKQGLELLVYLQSINMLREYVVIALGTNANYDYADRFTEIIDALSPGHRLIFVTPFDGRANINGKLTDETSDWMRELPGLYDFITIADWNAAISSQVNLLASDKVHLGRQPSMNLYAATITRAIRIAQSGNTS